MIDKLDYIKGLGTTAIWLTPRSRTSRCRAPATTPSAGYHGYWITDFTQIDPHLGTNDDMQRLIDGRPRQGDEGLLRHHHQPHRRRHRLPRGRSTTTSRRRRRPTRTPTATSSTTARTPGTDTFPTLDPESPSPTTRSCTRATSTSSSPSWLNDLTLYHNRGNTTFSGENSTYGDFFGLDDLFTEQPEGRPRHGGDLRHVDPRLRRRRLPHRHDEARQPRVLAAVPARTSGPTARSVGKSNFFAFGEVADQAPTRSCRASRPRAAARRCSTSPSSSRRASSPPRTRPTSCARCSARTTGSPTRTPTPTSCPPSWATTTWATSGCSCATTTRARRSPSCSGATSSPTPCCTSRAAIPSSTSATSRASPARATTRPRARTCSRSRDSEYNNLDDDGTDPLNGQNLNDGGKNDNIGSDVTPAADNFDRSHPLYRTIAGLARLRQTNPALADGASRRATRRRLPGSSPSRAPTPASRSSTSSP